MGAYKSKEFFQIDGPISVCGGWGVGGGGYELDFTVLTTVLCKLSLLPF